MGDGLLEGGEYVRAAEIFREVLSHDGSNVEAAFKLAFAYGKMGRYQDAISGFGRVLQLEPGNRGAVRNIVLIEAKAAAREAAPTR